MVHERSPSGYSSNPTLVVSNETTITSYYISRFDVGASSVKKILRLHCAVCTLGEKGNFSFKSATYYQ